MSILKPKLSCQPNYSRGRQETDPRHEPENLKYVFQDFDAAAG